MRAQDFISKQFILYINGKPAAKYQQEPDALRDMDHLRRHNPNVRLELKHEVCDLETVRSINEYKINNSDGIGAVPYNKDVDYFGLRVAMRPSTFLKLALPMNDSATDRQSVEHIKQNMDTKGIGAPFLQIDIPDGWENNDFSQPAKVTGHDGRHRMLAIMQSEGDEPVETHLFPVGLRRRHFDANPEWVQALNKQLISQRRVSMSGPFFQENAMNEAMFEYINSVEESVESVKPGNRHGTTRQKAEAYLGKSITENLSPADLKRLRAKTNKMKTSESKTERQRDIKWYRTFHK